MMQTARKRQGPRGLSSLLLVTALALLLQVLKHVPAGLNLTGLRKVGNATGTGEKLRSKGIALGNRLKDMSFPEMRELNSKFLPVLTSLPASARKRVAARTAGARASIAAGNFRGWAREASSRGLDDLQRAVKKAAAAAKRSSIPLVATAGRRLEASLLQAGQRIGDLSRRLKPDDEAIEDLEDDSEEMQSNVDDLGKSTRPRVNLQVAVELKLPSHEIRQLLDAATAEIDAALMNHAPELYKAERMAIQQIQSIAAKAGEQIQTVQSAAAAAVMEVQPILRQVDNATAVHRERVHRTGTEVVDRFVRPAATQVSDGMKRTLGPAAKHFQAALGKLRVALLNVPFGETTTGEALQQMHTTIADAAEQLSAVVRPTRVRISASVRTVLAASHAEARKGVQAVAALADRYLEAVTNEALRLLGIGIPSDEALELAGLEEPLPDEEEEEQPEEEEEEATRDEPEAATRRGYGPLIVLLLAAFVGTAVGLAVRRRRGTSSSTETPCTPSRSPGRASHGRTSPKTSKDVPQDASPKGSKHATKGGN